MNLKTQWKTVAAALPLALVGWLAPCSPAAAADPVLPVVNGGAQDEAIEKGEPPAPPFYHQAPDYAAWVVHVQTPPARTDGAKVLSELEVTKSPARLRQVSHWVDGTSSELWAYEGFILRQDPVGGYINILNVNQLEGVPDLTKDDFPELLWLSADNFIGKTKKEGHDCYAFQEDGKEAWIDIQTGLPWALKDENGAQTYEFVAAPTAPLTLPPNFQAPWDLYSRAIKAADVYKMAPPPPN